MFLTLGSGLTRIMPRLRAAACTGRVGWCGSVLAGAGWRCIRRSAAASAAAPTPSATQASTAASVYYAGQHQCCAAAAAAAAARARINACKSGLKFAPPPPPVFRKFWLKLLNLYIKSCRLPGIIRNGIVSNAIDEKFLRFLYGRTDFIRFVC